MKRYLVPVCLIALILAAPASAATRKTQRLQKQLTALKAQLATAEQQLATDRIQFGVDREQISGLRSQLAQRTTQRDALQTKLNAIPSPFAVATQQVQREVAWAQHYGAPYSYGRLVSQAALDYVAGHVSASAYGDLLLVGGPFPGPLDNPTPDSILGVQAGICGHDAIVFAAIVKHFGLQVRSVQFFEASGANHIGVEVYYEGGWHYFDPLYDLIWTDSNDNVLSLTDARASSDVIPQRNMLGFATFALGYTVSFELDPSTVVTFDGQKFHY